MYVRKTKIEVIVIDFAKRPRNRINNEVLKRPRPVNIVMSTTNA